MAHCCRSLLFVGPDDDGGGILFQVDNGRWWEAALKLSPLSPLVLRPLTMEEDAVVSVQLDQPEALASSSEDSDELESSSS